MNREEILSEIRDRLAKVYGGRLVEVILYGSVARGEEHEDSDIDVLVLLKEPGRRSHDEHQDAVNLRSRSGPFDQSDARRCRTVRNLRLPVVQDCARGGHHSR